MSGPTPDQRRAIEHDGGDALVSASAGSGKTFVMISRIIRLILEGKAEVGDILAVTYVKLAASEMKEKLTKAVLAEVAKGGERAELLRAQLAEIPTASISTLHAFCGDFLRTYFFEAGLDPQFSIMDEGEAEVLRAECADDLFERLFEAEDADLLHLAEVYSRKRRIAGLKSLVLELNGFLSAEERPFAFARDGLSAYTPENYARMRGELYADQRAETNELAEAFAAFARGAESIPKYAEAARLAAEALADFSREERPEDYFRALGAWPFAMPRLRIKEEDAEGKAAQAALKALTARVKKLREQAEIFAEDPGSGAAKLAASGRTAAALVSVTERFAADYAARKREDGKLDFSDLEHFTLDLLAREDVRAEAAARYKYVFADEYQDINGAQESILRKLSRDNLFMVGDIKQSIYAFRGCNPAFFAGKFRAFRGGAGEAVLLNGNFRSADAVLSAVNSVFSRVMTEGTGGLDYARDGAMTGGGLYGDHPGRATIRVAEEAEERDNPPKAGIYSVREDSLRREKPDAESRAVVSVVLEELGKTWYDIKDGTEKPVTYSDIVVLARSGAVAERVIRALAEEGIPVSAERKATIADYPEIQALIDLLRLIDCYEQDAPLASVLLSPVGGFTESELAAVRATRPAGSFRDAVRDYAACAGDPLAARLSDFAAYFAGVRDRADFLGAGELLERVISERGFDLFYAAREGGENALRRIRRLLAESEPGGKKLKAREFLERVEKLSGSLTLSEAGGADNVRVMSIHASKGLEFPVVILAGLSARFNDSDARKEVMTSREHGIAVKYYDLEARRQEETLLRRYVARSVRRANVREEMRVFYVAMTRAKYALHMICSDVPAARRTDRDILSATRLSDFLAPEDAPVLAVPPRAQEGYRPARKVLVGDPDPVLSSLIRENLNFVYPHADACGLDAKTTVTKLAESGEYYPVSALYGESSVEKGTAYHALLEAFARTGRLTDGASRSAGEIAATAEEWESGGLLPAGTTALLDAEQAAAALAMPVFRDLAGAKLYPEQPFMMSVPARELPERSSLRRSSDETVLVQGVIDLLAVKGGEAVILDYKLTAVARREDVAEKYRPQLELYRRAVERVLGLRVTRLSVVSLLALEEIPLLAPSTEIAPI